MHEMGLVRVRWRGCCVWAPQLPQSKPASTHLAASLGTLIITLAEPPPTVVKHSHVVEALGALVLRHLLAQTRHRLHGGPALRAWAKVWACVCVGWVGVGVGLVLKSTWPRVCLRSSQEDHMQTVQTSVSSPRA